MQINLLQYFDNPVFSQIKDKDAIVQHDRVITFRELDECARQYSNQPVAIGRPKSIDTVVINLRVAVSGNVFINLDMKSPDRRLISILEHLTGEFVVTDLTGRNRLSQAGWPEARVLLSEDTVNESTVYDVNDIQRHLSSVIDTDPFCIINTSGSTGIPKGVAISHQGVIDFIDWVTKTLGIKGGG